MERGLGSQRLTSVVPPQAVPASVETSADETVHRSSQPPLATPTPDTESSGWAAPTVARQAPQSAAIEVIQEVPATESEKNPGPRKSKTGVLVLGGVVVAALVGAGIVALAGSDGGGETSKDPAPVATPTTVRSTTPTTVRTSTPTTVGVTTTTIPPSPVARLWEVEGFHYRFNPCDHPVRLKLNPGGYLSEVDIANVESFLTEQAQQLSLITGITINYDGLTTQRSKDAVVENSKSILIHFGMPGEGLISAGIGRTERVVRDTIRRCQARWVPRATCVSNSRECCTDNLWREGVDQCRQAFPDASPRRISGSGLVVGR